MGLMFFGSLPSIRSPHSFRNPNPIALIARQWASKRGQLGGKRYGY